MSKVHAYIGFDGNCQEAMTFYQSALGGELDVQFVAESPAAAQMPVEMGPKVIHSSLTHEGFVLMASDMMSSTDLQRSQSVSLMLECHSAEEIERLFDQLGRGGHVTQPLTASFWGSTFGQLTDQYGIHWLFDHTHA